MTAEAVSSQQAPEAEAVTIVEKPEVESRTARSKLHRFDDLVTIPSLLTMLAIMLLTSVDATGRYLVNAPLEGAYEFTENYLLAATVFFAVGYGYRKDVYVRVTFLLGRFHGRTRRALDCLAHAFSVLAGLVMVYASLRQVLDTLASGIAMSGLLALPLWPAYSLLLLGLTWMTLLMIVDVPSVVRGVHRTAEGEIQVV